MTNIHVLSGVRIRDPKIQEAADLALDRKATGICHTYDMMLVFALTVDIWQPVLDGRFGFIFVTMDVITSN